jgi:hypothetical protein
MTVARTVADVLDDHTVFEIECIDRMYLDVYVPQLQDAAGLVGFVHRQLGLPIASTAPLGRISDAFTEGIRRYARNQGVPMEGYAKPPIITSRGLVRDRCLESWRHAA